MNIFNKTLWLVVLGVIVLVGMYKYAYMQGSIDTARSLDEIGSLQVMKTEAVLNALDAIKAKTILPSSGNSAAQIINTIFLDWMLIKDVLSQRQIQMVCSRVNDPEVALLLKSDQLYGEPKINWDQSGVKGIVGICQGIG